MARAIQIADVMAIDGRFPAHQERNRPQQDIAVPAVDCVHAVVLRDHVDHIGIIVSANRDAGYHQGLRIDLAVHGRRRGCGGNLAFQAKDRGLDVLVRDPALSQILPGTLDAGRTGADSRVVLLPGRHADWRAGRILRGAALEAIPTTNRAPKERVSNWR